MQTHSPAQRFLPKDFISTHEGLVFAVVESSLEDGRVLCFLRYAREASAWRKYATGAANALLKTAYPQYLYYSPSKDAYLHGVAVTGIDRHYRPRERLQSLLRQTASDPVEQDLVQLCRLLRQAGLPLQPFGVTGSLLIGAQNRNSDIDIVIYDRDCFQQARAAVRQLLKAGALQDLDAAEWQNTYARRGCALTLEEYIWHERRKYNKACLNGRKFDLSFIAPQPAETRQRYRKLGAVALRTRVKDARHAFDYPALLRLEHPEITECVSYSATYSGQAESGEWVSICGFLEQAENGARRIVIGSNREAHGEFVKVVKNHG